MRLSSSREPNTSGDEIHKLGQEIKPLRKQTRILQSCLIATVCGVLIAASPRTVDVLQARGIVIEDGAGRQRIVLGDPGTGIHSGGTRSSTTLVFKSENGQDRVLIGQEPAPSLDGKVYPRVAPGWGMLINAPDGSERGGFGYLDGRGASISIDRPTGDALGMLVNEKSGLSAMVLNYDNGGVLRSYPTAIEIGTIGNRAFIEASNRDGTSAGSLLAAGAGQAKLSNDTNLDHR